MWAILYYYTLSSAVRGHTCAQVASTARSSKPEWWGLQEPFPKLHALVAALSAGPVATGDGSGDLDVVSLSQVTITFTFHAIPAHHFDALPTIWIRPL